MPAQFRIPVAVSDPAAEIAIEPLCDPALHGHNAVAVTMDPRRHGKPYRYLIIGCIAGPRPCNSVTGVCRLDVTDGSVVMFHDLPTSIPAGMAAFVPRAGAADDDETDGVWLLDFLRADGHALIIVMSGRSFTEIARVTVPHRHCISLRNTWLPHTLGG